MYRKMIKDVFYARMVETEEIWKRRSRFWRKNLSKWDKEVIKVE